MMLSTLSDPLFFAMTPSRAILAAFLASTHELPWLVVRPMLLPSPSVPCIWTMPVRWLKGRPANTGELSASENQKIGIKTYVYIVRKRLFKFNPWEYPEPHFVVVDEDGGDLAVVEPEHLSMFLSAGLDVCKREG